MNNISRLLKEPEWEKKFSERERKEIDFCCEYVDTYNHGTDGHLVRTIVARMAVLLDMMEDGIVPDVETDPESDAEVEKEDNNAQQGLAKLADGDCTCSDNPNDGLRRCDTCEAAGILNEIGEIARDGLKEINEQQR